MYFKTLVSTALILSSALLSSCSMFSRPDQADIVILYTTDVHGALLPFDFTTGRTARTSLANVSTYVKQERAKNDLLLLFDTGDYLQGQPSLYYYNYVDTLQHHIVTRMFNDIGYDAVGLGNHDVEAGPSLYADRLKREFQMPLLCANAIDTATHRPAFKPYAVWEWHNVRIAVLGMITPHIPAWLPRALWPNLEFQDMVECAQQWVPYIQANEHPDILIGLFHAGSDPTMGDCDMDTYKNENGSLPVAVKVPGFDLILVGHDHNPGLTMVVNAAGDSVPVVDAGTRCRFVGRADIHLQLDPATKRYAKRIRHSLVPMDSVAVDTTFAATYDADVQAVNRFIDQPVGQLSAPLYAYDTPYGPSAFMSLIQDAQLAATGADISFASVLSPTAFVPQGTITMRHLFSIYKYENRLFTLRMTGQEVLRYLEWGYAHQFNQMRSAADPLLAYQRDSLGRLKTNNVGPLMAWPSFNYTYAAGIRYTVDVSKPAGQRVTIHGFTDSAEPFDLQRSYSVAINSYQACGGGDFLTRGLGWSADTIEARTIDASSLDVRHYIADYIKAKGTITPTERGEIQIVPTAWWQQAREREMKVFRDVH